MKFLSTIFFVFTYTLVGAQNFHHSYANLGIQYVNPALVNRSEEPTLSLALVHREQWHTFSSGYSLQSAYIAAQQDEWYVDCQLHQANHGGFYRQQQVKLSAAYQRALAAHHTLALASAIGIKNSRFDYTQLRFEEQFVQGIGFDRNKSNGEELPAKIPSQWGLSTGLAWHFDHPAKDLKGRVGISIIDLQDFRDQSSTFAAFGSLDVLINDQVTASPYGKYLSRGVQHETILGLGVQAIVNEDVNLGVGIGNRLGDAWIIQGTINWGNTTIVASYDWNTSALQAASQGSGAYEVGLQWEIPFKQKKYLKTKTNQTELCPLDTDKDGIMDDIDQCPNLPGIMANQGCPVLINDIDRDGVPDEEDECMYVKGVFSLNGCPDSDDDGITDKNDKCPYVKGDIDHSGCPDEEKSKD